MNFNDMFWLIIENSYGWHDFCTLGDCAAERDGCPAIKVWFSER